MAMQLLHVCSKNVDKKEVKLTTQLSSIQLSSYYSYCWLYNQLRYISYIASQLVKSAFSVYNYSMPCTAQPLFYKMQLASYIGNSYLLCITLKVNFINNGRLSLCEHISVWLISQHQLMGEALYILCLSIVCLFNIASSYSNTA